MANEPDAEDSAPTEEGGPVKSFLEHLEDLRWTLIKCASAVGIGVIISLIAGNYVVGILMRPLQQARAHYPGTNQVVSVRLGTNILGTYSLAPADEDLFNLDTNRNSPTFSAADIIRLKSFAVKLKQPDAKDGVSQYLTTQLSPDTRRLLQAYDFGTGSVFKRLVDLSREGNDPALQQALADDLSRVVQGGTIYDAQRFAGVPLDPALVAQAVQGPASARLNQRLLLAAYPKDLSKYHERFYVLDLVPMSNPGANRVSGLGYVVNTNLDAAAMAEHMKTTITALGPAKAFLIGFHVAIYAGLAMASPFVFFFIGQFVLPALRIREKKYLYRGLGFAIPLFVGGVCFCYFILLPAALAASQLYSNWFGFSSNIWDAGDYIGFVCKFMLGMGLGFELPVVLLVLVKIGLLSYSTLAKARPYMIVINLILGAVLTTPEVFTQILMAIPLQVLFEISVWIAWYWERQERKREAAANRAGN
jgi:sec-independent protein translocase protein TatC